MIRLSPYRKMVKGIARLTGLVWQWGDSLPQVRFPADSVSRPGKNTKPVAHIDKPGARRPRQPLPAKPLG